MREQAVITYTDAKAAGEPPSDKCRPKVRPTKIKQRNYGEDVKKYHEKYRVPVVSVVYII
jgi:hypothetical protein